MFLFIFLFCILCSRLSFLLRLLFSTVGSISVGRWAVYMYFALACVSTLLPTFPQLFSLSFTPNPASNKAKAWTRLLTVSTLVQDVCFFTELVILCNDVININVYITLWHHQRVHIGEDNCWYVERKSSSITSINLKQKYCFYQFIFVNL